MDIRDILATLDKINEDGDPELIPTPMDKIGDPQDIAARTANRNVARQKAQQLMQLQAALQKAIFKDTEQNQAISGTNWNQQKSLSESLVESFGYKLDEDKPLYKGTLAGGWNQIGSFPRQAPAAKTGSMDMSKLAANAKAFPGLDVAKKAGGSFLPGLGAGLSIYDVYDRIQKGDYIGAGISGLAGAAYLAPHPLVKGLGLGLDVLNYYLDQSKESDPSTPPVQPATSNEQIIKLQQQLKSQGADLGATGPNKDGIDGIIGRKTLAAMKKFGVEAPRDPELETLTAEAQKKGLVVVNKNNRIYLVYPPAQLVYDTDGRQLDPKTLTPLVNVPPGVIAEGGKAGTALAFVKNFGKATVEKGIQVLKSTGKWIKNNPKTAAAVGAGIGLGALSHSGDNGAAGSPTEPGAGAGGQAGQGAQQNPNVLPPGQNKEVQEIVKQMQALMADMTKLNDPIAVGAIKDARLQISQIEGLPPQLAIK